MIVSPGLVGLFDDLVVWLAIVWFVVALLESTPPPLLQPIP